MQFSQQSNAVLLWSVYYKHIQRTKSWQVLVSNAPDNHDVVSIQWQGEESFEVASSVFVTSFAPELLQQAVGGKNIHPALFTALPPSVGRRLVTHKQSHQRNWPGTF